MKMEVITYDVWGNAREGFWVNNAFRTGETVEIDWDKDSDRAINRRLGIRGVEWEFSWGTAYGTLKRNGMPALELRDVEPMGESV